MLLRNVRPPGSRQLQDLLVSGGGVAAIRPAGQLSGAEAQESCDAEGRTVLPGLWDHHVHFTQWVIQQQRLDLSGADSADETLRLVASAAAQLSASQRLTGFGFRDGLWHQPPTLAALDAATGEVPTVLVSADLHCMWINSAAQRQFGAATDATGLLRETESFAVLQRLDAAAELTTADYRRAADVAAARGVVGVVDFENDDNTALWPQRVAAGVDALRVEVSTWPDTLERVIDRGLKTGDGLDSQGLITMGPLKVIVDGSLNTRTAWCWDPYPGLAADHPHRCGVEAVPIEELTRLLQRANGAGIGAAVHAIGDRANTEVIDTFAALGMTGRVEHAQLLRVEDVARFAPLGLEASVQPEHAMDDRDVADAYWPGRTDRAFALRSLHESGARLRLGSDAPVSALDPWAQIAAAVTRSRDGRAPWHPEQSIDVATALRASTRAGLDLREGGPADLILVDADPLTATGEQLRSMEVAATMLAGRFTHWKL
ncbi:amidohydrolase family protein [Garicola koreensis]|uniref:Amidohydrolase 3 domain-containing protein n=1 Tax=Garicola koreensis TaxID=1262554 RepID=A0A7W5XPJ4_9MICC|nr:hypothetical protein [Garicola koreensis]